MAKGKSNLKTLLSAQQSRTAARLAEAKSAEARERKERSIAGGGSKGDGKKKTNGKSLYGKGKDGGSAAEKDRVKWGKLLEEQHRATLPKEMLQDERLKPLGEPTPKVIKDKHRLTYPFDHLDTILLIGEGNFSYALSLLLPPHSHPAHLLLATAYDDEQTCYAKYPDASEKVDQIKSLGARVAFEVDAGKLNKCKSIGKGRKWSKIVFNFPHAGAGIKDQDRNVLTNQHLLLQFFRSSSAILTSGPSAFPETEATFGKGGKQRKMPRGTVRKGRGGDRGGKGSGDEDEEELEGVSDLEDEDDQSSSWELPEPTTSELVPPTKPNQSDTFLPPHREGTILITLKTSLPYTLWDLPHLATRPPANGNHIPQPKYRILRSFVFRPELYEGYEHRRTIGYKDGLSKGGNEEILRGEKEGKGCRTWEFALKEEQYGG